MSVVSRHPSKYKQRQEAARLRREGRTRNGQWSDKLIQGAVAGFVATAPMTIIMEIGHRLLPEHERYPLPPRQITSQVTRIAGMQHRFSERQKSVLTVLAHFGYGASVGALFGLLAGHEKRDLNRGVLYGFFVWASSYLGLIPGLGILRPATQHPARRNVLMIVAHYVWGAAAAGAMQVLTRESKAAR